MATTAEQLMDRITKLPTAQKVAIVVAIAVVLTALNYFTLIDGSITDFNGQVKKMRNLEEEVIQAQNIANNLNQYRKEKEILEQQLAKALTELPEEANLPDLMKSLNDLGTRSGLSISTLEPGVEKSGDQGLYFQIPINMVVNGSYDEIGVFFDSVRQLKRIVNVSNIKMSNPHIKNDRVRLDASFTATSFRFNGQKKDDKGKDDKSGKSGSKDKPSK